MQDIINIDPVPLDELTLGEIDELEEHAQASIDMIAQIVTAPTDPEVIRMPKGRIMRALAYVQLKRDNPEATFEDSKRVRFNAEQLASASAEVQAEIAGNALTPQESLPS